MSKRRVFVDKRHLLVSYSGKDRPDGRKYKYKHNKCPVHTHYVQIFRLEIVVWTSS